MMKLSFNRLHVNWFFGRREDTASLPLSQLSGLGKREEGNSIDYCEGYGTVKYIEEME